MKNQVKDPLYVRMLAGLVRPFPDFDFSFIKPVRKKAIEWLQLKAGDRVIDAGCGSGGSFPFLLHAVTDTGEITGIDISPATLINTKRRVVKNKWENIVLLQGDAGQVQLTGMYDGLLMFAAPDVFASDQAIANLFPHLKPGASVVFFGAKLTSAKSGILLNPLLKLAFNLTFSSTPGPHHKPWNLIESKLKDFKVQEYFFGSMFLASGRL